jgi:hypothetical protein
VADHYVDASNGGQVLAAFPAMATAAVTDTPSGRCSGAVHRSPPGGAIRKYTLDPLPDGRFDLGLGAGG